MLWQKQKQPILPEIELHGPRIMLRPPKLSDWPAWHETRTKNKAYLKPFEPR